MPPGPALREPQVGCGGRRRLGKFPARAGALGVFLSRARTEQRPGGLIAIVRAGESWNARLGRQKGVH